LLVLALALYWVVIFSGRSAFPPAAAASEADRRGAKRYPIEAEASYKLLDQGRWHELHQCVAFNISNSGVWLKSERALPVGARIDVVLDWPTRLNSATDVVLNIEGRIVRSNGDHVAVCVERSSFVTRSDQAMVRGEKHSRQSRSA
jgi:hypothetical protein